ncbi:MAG TPA: VOC family protein [Vicinamibacterales bacterium]|nr:VOC family protein [Vicinamibacterales bacterium]
MNSTQLANARATTIPGTGTIDMKLEVVVIPVSDIDRAKRFYQGLNWRLDADLISGDGSRVVQLTPPGSPCSIHLRQRNHDAPGGVSAGTWLIVSDLEAARAELSGRGVDVSAVFHFETGRTGPVPGPDPAGRSYSSFASFSDPDGNSWLLQEIKTRLPGRGLSNDVATLIDLLRETEMRHGQYEPTAPKHHWSEWYAGYMIARERGGSQDQAASDAAARLEGGRA